MLRKISLVVVVFLGTLTVIFLKAFASPLVSCTVIYVELMTVFKTSNICTRKFNNIWLEVDATLLINILYKEAKGNADTYYLLNET